MTTQTDRPTDFDTEADEQDVAEQLQPGAVAAYVTGNDWTAETIVSQLSKGNIQLNPSFQRRDAWKLDRKSRFIESLIVGLPIPQIVLAESKEDRGRFIVLDGKQRLLAILQFWGKAPDGPNNGYGLSGLTLRSDLIRKTYRDIESDPKREADLNALNNQPIRTVVIRNWKDTNFLHTVFLRLNTGSVSLSPQELRQALQPGLFSNYIDERAARSKSLQKLLGINEPDPRMRDIEIVARFLAFRFFASSYPGRLKAFIDSAFEKFNGQWNKYETPVEHAVCEFEDGIDELIKVFGTDLARKPGSPQFNRAIFDALIYFHSQPELCRPLRSKRKELKTTYMQLFEPGSDFRSAVESDTAGAPNTALRLRLWGEALSRLLDAEVPIPKVPQNATPTRAKPAKRK